MSTKNPLLSHAEKTVTPVLDLCDDDVVDTAVRTVDSNIYLFKGKYYFKLNQTTKKLEAPVRIVDNWKNLPDGPEISFTITDKRNWLYGKTIFVKTNRTGRSYYVFENQQYITTGKTDKWTKLPWDLNYAIVAFNDSIVGIHRQTVTSFHFSAKHLFAVYLFDDLTVPYLLQSELEYGPRTTMSLGPIRAIFQMPDGTWYVYYVEKDDGWYCKLKHLGGTCRALYIRETLLDCPSEMMNVESIYFWDNEKISTGIIAVLVSIVIVLGIVHIGVSLTLRELYKEKYGID